MAGIFESIGQTVFFDVIRDYIDNEIAVFQIDVVSRVLGIVGAVALTLLTLWIMVKGYMIITGRMRDSMMAFVIDASKALVIILIATGVAFGGNQLFSTLNNGLSNSVAYLFTGGSSAASCTGAGNDSFLGCAIDKNLALMQVALGGIQSLDTGDNPIVEDEKNRALWMSGIGVAGPAIIAGVLLLLNKFAMALFVSLGPIFILCLLFDQTKALFHKWLYFGIATTFTTVMLAVMSSIAMKMVGALAASVIAADFLGANTSGFTQVAMQQGGLGLILSTLLITVPPMAGNFFSQSLGMFQSQSAFGQLSGNGNLGGRGADGRNGSTVVQGGAASQSPTGGNHVNSPLVTSVASTAIPQTDTIKSHSMMGNATQASTQPMLQAHSAGASFNADSIKSMGDDSIAIKQKYNNLLTTPSKAEA